MNITEGQYMHFQSISREQASWHIVYVHHQTFSQHNYTTCLKLSICCFLFNKKNMCLRFPESLNYLDEYGHSQFYKTYLHLYTDHLLQANSVHWTSVPLHLHWLQISPAENTSWSSYITPLYSHAIVKKD